MVICDKFPWVVIEESSAEIIHSLTQQAIKIQQSLLARHEESISFVAPIYILTKPNGSLRYGLNRNEIERLKSQVQLIELDYELDLISQRVFSVSVEEQIAIETVVGKHSLDLPRIPDASLIEEDLDLRAHRTSLFPIETKAWKQKRNPQEIIKDEKVLDSLIDIKSEVKSLISYFLGVCLGRWDIRSSIDQLDSTLSRNPFASLPTCPPGMLKNRDGLPAVPADVPVGYPIRISWSGILVDDPGHSEDIELRVSEVINVIWSDRANVIEQEMCEILELDSIRLYLANPNKLFRRPPETLLEEPP